MPESAWGFSVVETVGVCCGASVVAEGYGISSVGVILYIICTLVILYIINCWNIIINCWNITNRV